MKAKRFILLLTVLAAWMAAAAQASFSLVQPRTAVAGHKFTITFRLSNGSASAPKAPEINNCTLVYGPSTSTMQSTQIINGKVSSSSSIDYTFTYQANEEGTANVPAVSVVVDGKTLTSNPAQFNILPPDKSSHPTSPGAATAPSTPSADHKFSAEDMFVRVSINKSSVYEQEPVVATVKVYTLYNISSFRVVAQPTFEGFLSEELDVPNGVEMEHYNGKNYYTAILKRCIIYPQKSGALKITSGTFDVTLVDYEIVSNGFFQTRRPVEKQVQTSSNSATVNVLPLPEPKPASFMGAVGDFNAQVELKPLEMRTNEAASYIFKVEGTGNIKYLTVPTIDLPMGVDQFTPKTDIKANFTGSNMRGSYTVNYTLVPQEPGNFEIPGWQFTYFNPADKKYHTLDMQSFDIRVAQGATTSAVTEQKAIAKGMTDILHIKPTGQLSHSLHYVFRTPLYWILYIACTLALIILAFAYRRQLKLNADVKGRKLARANKQATKRFKAARGYMAAHEADKFYASLNQAMWGYLSDKLGIPASQLVRDNISAQLTDYGLPEDAVTETIHVLDECEMARFTPQHTDSEMSQLYDMAVAAVKSIESVKK